MSLSFKDYQLGTDRTAEPYRDATEKMIASVTPDDPYLTNLSAEGVLRAHLRITYLAGKLNGEAGEVAEMVFKNFRDDGEFSPRRRDEIRKEIGDCLWYLSQLCNEFGWWLEDVAQENLNKLASRQERGVLGGSGDNR